MSGTKKYEEGGCCRRGWLRGTAVIVALATGLFMGASGVSAQPDNDLCEDAISIMEGVAVNASSAGATGTDVTSCTSSDTLDVWYSWMADCTGTVTVSLCGSSFDTSLAIFDSCALTTQIACNDDASGICSPQSQLTFTAQSGIEYLIRVAGWNNNFGNFMLLVSCPPTGGCCTGAGACQVLSQGECDSLLGFYRGDDSDCGPGGMACSFGACCDSAGNCNEEGTETDCANAGGYYSGDGTSCAGVTCPDYGACCTSGVCADAFAPDCASGGGLFIGAGTNCNANTCDGIIELNNNWNGMVHAGERDNPDSLPGYRSIADRGLSMGNPNSAGGTAFRLTSGDLTYYFERTADVVDIIHIGNANAFDDVDDTDNRGIAPSWDPSGGTGFVASSTTNLSKMLDANFKMGVLYHGSRNGGTFLMTLNFSDTSFAQVTLDAPDWFANNAGNIPDPPAAGVATQMLLPGLLSSGRGFEATANFDEGDPSDPLNIVEATVTRDSLLGQIDVDGKTLTSIVFDSWSGSATSGNAIFAASLALPGACCDSIGGCTESLRSVCEAGGGIYLGDATNCIDDGGACMVGACCLQNGSCGDDGSEEDCLNAGGIYFGNGTNCGNVECPPVGACCIDTGAVVDCMITFEANCGTSGGTYLGDESECGTQPNEGSICDCNGNGTFDDLDLLTSNNVPMTYFSTDTPIAILDNNANGAVSPIVVATAGTVSDVNVTIDITHANTGHLDIRLRYDDGSSCHEIELATDVGFSANFSGTVFDDSAATAITSGSAPYAGTFRPEQPLSDFIGRDAAGTWTLIVGDDTTGTTGTLNSWSIEITAGDAPVSTDCNGNGILDECEIPDPTTVGACCFVDATCLTTTGAMCDSQGGIYSGDCTNCIDDACPGVGACCVSGNCSIATFVDCGTAGGFYAGDGVTCGEYDCTRGACCTPGVGCDDSGDATGCTGPTDIYYGDGTRCADLSCAGPQSIRLNYNWNGIVHPGEAGMPDAPNGYRSIGDRGITYGNANSFGGAAGSSTLGNLTYDLVPLAAPALDVIHVGYRKDAWDCLGGPNATVGIQPLWDPSMDGDGKFVPSNTTSFTPTTALDATFELGILYNASEGGGDFDMTLRFTDNSEVTVRFDSKDWFANGNPNPETPGATSGIASMIKLAGPLSAGDGFEGTTATDAATIENPLSVFEGRVTYASLLAMTTSFDVTGKQLSSIRFDNWSPNSAGNTAAGVAIYAASMVTPAPGGCACLGDVSDDTFVDGGDIQAFVDCVLGSGSNCDCADVDGMNGADLGDVAGFVANLLTANPGCIVP